MKNLTLIITVTILFFSCSNKKIDTSAKLFQAIKTNQSNEAVLKTLIYSLNDKWYSQERIIKGIICNTKENCNAIIYCSEVALDSLSIQDFTPVDSLKKIHKLYANLFLDNNTRLFDIIPSSELYYFSKHQTKVILKKEKNQFKLVQFENLELFDNNQFPNKYDLDVFDEFWKLKNRLSNIETTKKIENISSLNSQITQQIEKSLKQINIIASIYLKELDLPIELFTEPNKNEWENFYPCARKKFNPNNLMTLFTSNFNQFSILKNEIKKINKLTNSTHLTLNTSDILSNREAVTYNWEGYNFEINNLMLFLIKLKQLELDIKLLKTLYNT